HDEWRKLDRIEAAIRGDAVRAPEEVVELVDKFEPSSADGARRSGGASEHALGIGANLAVAADHGGRYDRRTRALALPFDWKRDGLRRNFLLAVLALVVPLVVMTAGWRRTTRTADFDRAVGGLAVVMVGVVLAVAIGALYTASLRGKIKRR